MPTGLSGTSFQTLQIFINVTFHGLSGLKHTSLTGADNQQPFQMASSSILVRLQPDGLGCTLGTFPISSLPLGFDLSTVGMQEHDHQKQEFCRMTEEYFPLVWTGVLQVNITSNLNPSRIKSCTTWLCLKCGHSLRVKNTKGLHKI